MKTIPALTALLFSAVPVSGAAQDTWIEQADAHLYSVLSRDGREGGGLVRPPVTGSLYEEGIDEQEIRLPAGAYVVVAACDTACGDLDLRVVADDGSTVASDTDPHPYALVDLDAAASMGYRVRVSMVACASEPCRFTAGIIRIDP